jgi:hypothetical protein
MKNPFPLVVVAYSAFSCSNRYYNFVISSAERQLEKEKLSQIIGWAGQQSVQRRATFCLEKIA